jgi:hypothetical protein
MWNLESNKLSFQCEPTVRKRWFLTGIHVNLLSIFWGPGGTGVLAVPQLPKVHIISAMNVKKRWIHLWFLIQLSGGLTWSPQIEVVWQVLTKSGRQNVIDRPLSCGLSVITRCITCDRQQTVEPERHDRQPVERTLKARSQSSPAQPAPGQKMVDSMWRFGTKACQFRWKPSG